MRGTVIALALATPGASAVDGKAGGKLSTLHGFNKIIASGLGEDLSHDDGLFAKATAFERGRLIDEPSAMSAMLACTPLSLGSAAREALHDFLGEERVVPAYSSRQEDAACFVISATYKESRDLQMQRVVEDITVFPASARLAEGTLSYRASLDSFDKTGVHPHSR